jgi:hypothetical protein
MKKFHKMELKSPSIPLLPPGQRPKGETPIPLPFIKGGGEGLFLFQKAKFIQKREFSRISNFKLHGGRARDIIKRHGSLL